MRFSNPARDENDNVIVKQTVRFTTVMLFLHAELTEGKEREVQLSFDSFEEMIERWRVERRRRKRGDRLTSAQYRMHLTDAGKARIKEDEYARESHKHAIDGTWFPVRF